MPTSMLLSIRVLAPALLLLGALLPSSAAAQCTGCTQTLTANSSANINLSAGDVLCINTGVTYTGNLNMNGGTVCNQGTFAPANANVNAGTINNYGTANLGNFNINNGVVFNNYGTLNVSGNLNINMGGTLNQFAGTVAIGGAVQVNGTWNAHTPVTINGSLTVNSSGSLAICDAFSVGGAFMNNGNVQGMHGSNGCLSIGGSFVQNSGGQLGTTAGLNYCVAGSLVNNGNIGPTNTTQCPTPAQPCGSTLPLAAVAFWATRVGNYHQLTWQPVDAQAAAAEWQLMDESGQLIALLPGHVLQYAQPVAPAQGSGTYRLAGLDANGQRVCLAEATATPRAQSHTALFVVSGPYGQPRLHCTAGVLLTVWAVHGVCIQEIYTTENEVVSLDGLPSGVYVVRATHPQGSVQTQRVWVR